jgi:hypothetical protein
MSKTLWNSKPCMKFLNLKVPSNINELAKNVVNRSTDARTILYKIKVKLKDLLFEVD